MVKFLIDWPKLKPHMHLLLEVQGQIKTQEITENVQKKDKFPENWPGFVNCT